MPTRVWMHRRATDYPHTRRFRDGLPFEGPDPTRLTKEEKRISCGVTLANICCSVPEGVLAMAAVEKLGGNWIIVRDADRRQIGSTPIASEEESFASREFWTGEGWAAQYGFAKQFLTQQEAEADFAEHRHRMG